MAGDGIILERQEAPAPIHHQTVDRPKVYVCADDPRQAHNWARENKPGHLPKIYSNASEIGPRGLMLPDDTPVFVLGEMPQHIREAWALTGGKLVYV